MSLNSNIVLVKEPRYVNTKASEEYVHVKFKYPDVTKEWDGWVPVEYRRTGVYLFPFLLKMSSKSISTAFTSKCIHPNTRRG